VESNCPCGLSRLMSCTRSAPRDIMTRNKAIDPSPSKPRIAHRRRSPSSPSESNTMRLMRSAPPRPNALHFACTYAAGESETLQSDDLCGVQHFRNSIEFLIK
jgi:hypothetical protein